MNKSTASPPETPAKEPKQGFFAWLTALMVLLLATRAIKVLGLHFGILIFLFLWGVVDAFGGGNLDALITIGFVVYVIFAWRVTSVVVGKTQGVGWVGVVARMFFDAIGRVFAFVSRWVRRVSEMGPPTTDTGETLFFIAFCLSIVFAIGGFNIAVHMFHQLAWAADHHGVTDLSFAFVLTSVDLALLCGSLVANGGVEYLYAPEETEDEVEKAMKRTENSEPFLDEGSSGLGVTGCL